MRTRLSVLILSVLIFVLFLTACSSSTTGARPTTTSDPQTSEFESTTTSFVAATIAPGGFNAHDAASLESADDFFSLAATDEQGVASVKFVIPDMPNQGEVFWMDSSFYSLHDEWYWWRLLNGEEVPGTDVEPVEDLGFTSIAEVYAWAQRLDADALPLDLTWAGSERTSERLYSPQFYDLALHSDPRNFGVGSLVFFPDSVDDRAGRWLIELEYTDAVTVEDVELFFERLQASAGPEIGDALEWVVRSPSHEVVALEMQQAGHPLAARITTYRDLVPVGQTAVYNEGIAAGRLRLIESEFDLTLARATDILLVENPLDTLPPATGLISSAPQTPLAHVNLLARNRGIPNASVAGVTDDPDILQAAKSRAPALLSAAVGSDGEAVVSLVLLTDEEYQGWRALNQPSPIGVPAVDVESLPYFIDLTEAELAIQSAADVAALRPVIGGKSAGFLALLGTDELTEPLTPQAITVRPYFEHLDLLKTELDAMLSNSGFVEERWVRYLLLEGPEAFAEIYTAESDGAAAEAFQASYPPGTPIGNILEAGGFMDLFRERSMDPATLVALEEYLDATFGDYAPTQGLRFRSSSSVEDIEGFSGAGLYDSNTGFLDPLAQPDEDDHKKTIERTIKKTWASYWSFEAFEERRLENVDHRSGGMGVLVHARFDDALEVNNGVLTLTLLPDGGSEATINVQRGDVSVTNPDPEAFDLPEEIEVTIGRDSELTIDRVSESTIDGEGPVLGDIEIAELVRAAERTTVLWRDQENATLIASHQISTVTLDFEFKTMDAGWPAFAQEDAQLPGRLVIKQARSLDPGLRGLVAEVRELPIPRDVLARASHIERLDCDIYEVFTSPTASPDFGYSRAPFRLTADTPGESCDPEVLLTTADRYLSEILGLADRRSLLG